MAAIIRNCGGTRDSREGRSPTDSGWHCVTRVMARRPEIRRYRAIVNNRPTKTDKWPCQFKVNVQPERIILLFNTSSPIASCGSASIVSRLEYCFGLLKALLLLWPAFTSSSFAFCTSVSLRSSSLRNFTFGFGEIPQSFPLRFFTTSRFSILCPDGK